MLTLGIVHWRGLNYLGPTNENLTCHMVLNVTPINPREALSPSRRFSTIATLLIYWSHHGLQNPNTHPTFRFGKTMCRNSTTLIMDHKNKWDDVGLMDRYYVVGIITIPYPGFRVSSVIGVVLSRMYKNVSKWHVLDYKSTMDWKYSKWSMVIGPLHS